MIADQAQFIHLHSEKMAGGVARLHANNTTHVQ